MPTILVRSHITAIKKTQHDPSGRALAVDIVPDGCKGKYLRLIALYQPPGLDYIAAADPAVPIPPFNPELAGAGSVPRAARRLEAERLRKAVRRWKCARKVGWAILGADCNQTVLGAVDRQAASTDRPSKERNGTIHAMLDDDGWCDWFRHCHPAPLDDPSALSTTIRGHTYFDPCGGSSRIDYVMFFPTPAFHGVCAVDDTFRLGSDTHHRPLELRARYASGQSALRGGRPSQR